LREPVGTSPEAGLPFCSSGLGLVPIRRCPGVSVVDSGRRQKVVEA
jgi:hypothetical protein